MCDTELAVKRMSVGSVADSEPPAKRPREEDEDEEGSSVEEFRTNLQALLVGVDLNEVKIGETRALLERRLGLEEGELGSKRVRRQVVQALRLEVAGKLRRDDDSEVVAKALVAYEECDAGARQMVIESLPLAAAGTSDYHLRFLAIARDLLLEGRQAAVVVLEEGRVRSRAAEEEETGAREAAAGPLAQKVAAARDQVCHRLLAQSAAERDEAAEKAEYEAMESEHGPHAMQLTTNRLENAKQRHAFISSCQMRILVDGSWTDEQERDAAIEALLSHFEATGAEAALATAMPAALKRRPDDRRPFDRLTANAVEEALADEVAGLNTRLAALPSAAEAEATMLAAKATLTAASARVATSVAERSSAEAALASAVNEQANEEAWVVEQAAIVSACALELAPVLQKVAIMDNGLAALDRLCNPPAAAAADAGELPEDSEMAAAEAVAATPARAAASQGEVLTEKIAHPKALPAAEAMSTCDTQASLEAAPVEAAPLELESAPQAVSSQEADVPSETWQEVSSWIEPAATVESVTLVELPVTTAVAETMSGGGDAEADTLTLSALSEPEEEAADQAAPEAVDALATTAPASPAIAGGPRPSGGVRDKSCERRRSVSFGRPVPSPARTGAGRRSDSPAALLLPARCLSFEGAPLVKLQAVVPDAPEHEPAAVAGRMSRRRLHGRASERRKSGGDMSPAAA